MNAPARVRGLEGDSCDAPERDAGTPASFACAVVLHPTWDPEFIPLLRKCGLFVYGTRVYPIAVGTRGAMATLCSAPPCMYPLRILLHPVFAYCYAALWFFEQYTGSESMACTEMRARVFYFLGVFRQPAMIPDTPPPAWLAAHLPASATELPVVPHRDSDMHSAIAKLAQEEEYRRLYEQHRVIFARGRCAAITAAIADFPWPQFDDVHTMVECTTSPVVATCCGRVPAFAACVLLNATLASETRKVGRNAVTAEASALLGVFGYSFNYVYTPPTPPVAEAYDYVFGPDEHTRMRTLSCSSEGLLDE